MFMVATCVVARTGPSEAREILVPVEGDRENKMEMDRARTGPSEAREMPVEGDRENKMEMDRAKWSGMDGSL